MREESLRQIKEKALSEGRIEGLTKEDIFEILKKRIEELTRKMEIKDRQFRLVEQTGREFSTLLNVDGITTTIHTFLKEVLDINHSIVFLKEDTGDGFSAYSYYGYPNEVSNYKITPGEGMIGVVAETKRAMVVNKATQDANLLVSPETGRPLGGDRKIEPKNDHFQGMEEAQSRLAVPLLSMKGIIGVLFLEDERPDFFKHEYREAINLVAVQMSTAIYNARLFPELKHKIDELGSLNQQLQASEPQLRASNQQLQASEQQLRAANQQLQANEQQLRSNNQQLMVNEQQLRAEITERKKAEEKIRRAAEEWETTFNSIADMVSVHDLRFNLVRCNKSFANAVKLDPQELIGKACYEIIHGAKEPWPDCPYKAAVETKRPVYAEFFEPHLGIWLGVSVAPIFNENNMVVGATHIAKDITVRKRIEEETRKHLHDLEIFYKASRGREERIVELKKEIEELKGKQ